MKKAIIHMDKGDIVIELFPKEAPKQWLILKN